MFGHVHIYERNKGIGINGTVDPNGYNNPKYPVYLTNGAGGHYDGLDAIVPNNNSWSTFALDSVYGWSRITIHNRTHLTQDFIASTNGSVVDTFTLYKQH
jgi:hypothetical protein